MERKNGTNGVLISKLMKRMVAASIVALAIFIFTAVSPSQASRIEKLNDLNVMGDFDLGPTSYSIDAAPGETVRRTLQLTDRKGERQEYKISVEDFQGSSDNPEQTVLMQGDKSGKYGAKDWVTPELTDFTLDHGDRQHFDITISIPEDADPGDHYATVLVSGLPTKKDQDNPAESQNGNVMITSRVGCLLYIRVKGPVKEEGQLKSFYTDHNWATEGPVDFKMVFENTGSVRLRPFGNIEVSNMLGRKTADVPVQAFNVLRDSKRMMKQSWDQKWMLGRYTATLDLKRGYGEESDSRTITFWVLPWKKMLVGLAVLIVIIFIITFIRKNVSFNVGIKKKRR